MQNKGKKIKEKKKKAVQLSAPAYLSIVFQVHLKHSDKQR